MKFEQRDLVKEARARALFGRILRIKTALDDLMTPEERARTRKLRDIREAIREERGLQLLEQQQGRAGTIVDFRGATLVPQSGAVLIG